jgi:membrane-bound metal-dependent hydrolase YbcI (DUF457 family)
MDLFTHVLVAYLLSFVVFGPHAPLYIAAGALAGGLPDADILFFPLSRRYPLWGHHGITHSIFGVSVIAVAGGLLAPLLVGGSGWYYLLAMELGGLSHVALDGFTNFSVPPLAPFSSRSVHLDADRAVNFATLGMTVVAFVVLLEERNTVPSPVWVLTAWVLVGVYAGYLAVRGTARIRIGRIGRAAGYSGVIPSGNPLRWTLIDERLDPQGESTVRFRRYRLGRGWSGNGAELRVHPAEATAPAGPVAQAQEAIDRSYPAAMARSRFLARSYFFAEVTPSPEAFEVFWYSLEFESMGRSAGVIARVDRASGRVETRSTWRRVPLSGSSPVTP